MRSKRATRGFTLVELMIVVAIIGILAALAVFGVSKYVATSKTAEARNGVGQMSKDAVTAYARENMDADKLNLKSSRAGVKRLCVSSTPVPATMDSVRARKYQSHPREWDAFDDDTGWPCLKFTMDTPQYYQYQYISEGGDWVGANFMAVASGDLDGDGTPSVFSIRGEIQSTSTTGLGGQKVLTVDPGIAEAFPTE